MPQLTDAMITMSRTDHGMTLMPGMRPAAVAVAAGVSAGVAYTASPLTVWFLIALAFLFHRAVRGLTGRERNIVLGLLAAAVSVRLLVLAWLFLTTDHSRPASFFWDGDGTYLKQRAIWIRNVWLDVPISTFSFNSAFDRLYGWTTYIYLLAYLQYLFGPAPYAVHLLNVLAFLGAAVILYRLVRSTYGPAAAIVGLALLLFLPTIFAWSISALKESLVLFGNAICLAAVVKLIRGPGVGGRLSALAILVAGVASLEGVRVGTQLILVAGLGAGIGASVVIRRPWLVLLLVIVLPFAAWGLANRPDVQADLMEKLGRSAVMHVGHVRTEGHHYKLLDQRLYSRDVRPDQLRPIEAVRFVVRSLVAYVVVPLPWQIQSKPELVYLPQQVVWYILVAMAIVGVAAGLQRDALVTCLLVCLSVVASVAIALNSGNIGTLVRFRDMVVPFVLWLSAYGIVRTGGALVSHDPAARRDPLCP